MTAQPVRFVSVRLVAGALALLLATIAAGQGAERHFPAPMSWATLRQQLDRLPPAQAQWEDLKTAHTLYLVDMEDLRTGPITRWLDEHGTALQGFIEDVSGTRTAFRERDVLLNRIASIDDDYFARAAAIMGDEQQLALERLRLRRARERMVKERHTTPLMGFELADHVDPHLLDQDMQGMLYDWEDRRTDLLQAHVQVQRAEILALTEMAASWSSKMADLIASDDKEAIQAVAKQTQAEAHELRMPASKTAQAISEQAWRGARELADILPLEDAHAVRMSVIRQLGAMVDEGFQRNLQAAGISTDNEAVRPLLEDYWSDMAGLTTTAAATILALPHEDMMFLAVDDMEKIPWLQRFDDIQQAQEPLQARARRLNEALGALGGPGQPLELAHRPAQPSVISESSVEIIVGSTGSPMDLTAGSTVIMSSSVSLDGDMLGSSDGMNMGAMFGFKSMPGSLRARLIRDLALDQEGIDALDALLEAHGAALAQPQETTVAASFNEGDGQIMFSPFGASAEGRAITQVADDAFFQGTQALGHSEAVQWHRLARKRSLAGSGDLMGIISLGMGGSGQAHRADPMEALESAELDDAHITQSLRALGNWHELATAAADNLHSASEAQQEAMQAQMQQQFAEQDSDGSLDISMSIDGSAIKGLQERLRKAQVELARANRQGIDLLMANLSEDDALRVRRAWMVKAWPDILDKGDPLQSSFDSAMQLDDLTDTQRGKMAMLRMQHDTQWWASSEKIIDELDANTDISLLMDGRSTQDMMSAFQAFERNRDELERKKFARREAALKQLAALREMLTEAQLAQARGLPDPASAQSQHILSF